MTPKDVLGMTRENLRDTKEPYRFSDELLLGILNQQQNHISVSFRLPIAVFKQEVSPQDSSVILPTIPLKLLRVTLNNNPLEVCSIYTLNPSQKALVFVDTQVYELHNVRGGYLEIFYVPSCPAKSLEDTLALSDIFLDLLTFYISKRANQIETNSQNLQRVQFYESLIKGEEDRIRKIISGLNSQLVATPYKIV